MAEELQRFRDLWCLEADGEPVRTATSTIQFVSRDGVRCLLKLAHEKSDEATATALAHFAGQGAVKLLAHEGAATLMQRAMPGRALTELVTAAQDDQATRIAAATMARLHARSSQLPKLRRIESWAAAFTSEATSSFPQATVALASDIYDDLCRTQSAPVVLHGDLHHDNILFDEEYGWLAIDPKGVIGEPEFETGALLRNPTDDPRNFATRAIVDRRVAILCEMLGFQRQRLLRWSFAQGVLSAIWSIQDGENPARGLAIATTARAMI